MSCNDFVYFTVVFAGLFLILHLQHQCHGQSCDETRRKPGTSQAAHRVLLTGLFSFHEKKFDKLCSCVCSGENAGKQDAHTGFSETSAKAVAARKARVSEVHVHAYRFEWFKMCEVST